MINGKGGGKIVALFAVLLFAVLGTVSAQQYTIRFNTTASPTETQVAAMHKFADVVGELSGGKIQVRVYHSGQLGDQKTGLLGVMKGSLEMSCDASPLWFADLANYPEIGVLEAAPGQNQNALAVLPETAVRRGLSPVSDLRPVASTMVLGGPPECPTRPLCMIGYADVYGLRFRRFVPLDVGGSLTLAALQTGEIDVAVLFTGDRTVIGPEVVFLTDDRGLQPVVGAVLVTAVAPGVILSSGTARYPTAVLARATSQTPLKRAGSCEEVAASIVFLASPAA